MLSVLPRILPSLACITGVENFSGKQLLIERTWKQEGTTRSGSSFPGGQRNVGTKHWHKDSASGLLWAGAALPVLLSVSSELTR